MKKILILAALCVLVAGCAVESLMLELHDARTAGISATEKP